MADTGGKRRSGWLWLWLALFVTAIILLIMWAWPAREPPASNPGTSSAARIAAPSPPSSVPVHHGARR